MNCPNCNKEIRDDAKFCTGCGKPIPRCPTCGRALQRPTRFCPVDGTRIPDEINALLPGEQQPAPPVPPMPVPTAPPVPPVPPAPPVPPVPEEQKKQPRPQKPQKPEKEKKGSALTVVLVVLLSVLILAVAAVAVSIGMGWIDLGDVELPAFVQDLTGREEETEAESSEQTEPVPETEPETEPPTEPETIPETTPPLMPDCVGLYYTDAADLLNGVDCIPFFEYAYSDEVAEGYIIEQGLPENELLPVGGSVSFIVSKGPDVSPDGYNQKVVVTAASGATRGTLTLYDWENGQWVAKFSCDCTVGKNGIGTDYGEGKKKTPQGTYKLGIALSANGIPNTTWPHQWVTSDTCVVDDTGSAYYNTIRSISGLPSGVSYDPIGNTLLKGYSNVCIYIEHNGNGLDSNNVVAGKGSVITICGRTAAIEATAGCVDISASNMTTLMGLLVYEDNPHIEIGVQ